MTLKYIKIKYLESVGVYHCDLAARNVLVAHNVEGPICKIADFGRAVKQIPHKKDMMCTTKDDECRQALRWMPPETQYAPTVYTSKTDIWSFGVLCYEIVYNGKKPYIFDSRPMSNERVIYNLQLEEFAKKMLKIPRELEKCLNDNPEDRPTFTEIITVLMLLDDKSDYNLRVSSTPLF